MAQKPVAPDPAVDVRLPATGWRRWFVVLPAIGGVLLCVAGVALETGTGANGGLPAYLCVLVGGWAVAFAIVNALSALHERTAWIVHVVLAVAMAALLSSSLSALGALEAVSAPWRSALGFAALALPPACGWVLLTLLGRVLGLLTGRAARRAAARPRLAWSEGDGRPGLTVMAARVSRARVTAFVVVATIASGAVAAGAVIFAERWVSRLGPMLLVFLIGSVIVLPSYLIARAIANKRRIPLTLRWRTGAIIVDTDASWTVPFATLTRLVWQERGDLARIELHTAQRSETYLVGLVRQDAGASSELPPLQRQMVRVLEDAGLPARVRRDAVRFQRPPRRPE